MSNTSSSAREAAMSALDSFEVTPTSLISYQSNGQVVVIGDQDSLIFCHQWANADNLTMISTTEESLPNASNGVIHLQKRDIQIEGHLGAFNVQLADVHKNVQTIRADILLDLSPEPVNKQQLLPPGYLHTRINLENLHEIEAQVEDLVGEFDKPKFFNYDASICAHSVNTKTVCTQCIDACPAGAIESIVESIQVNPYLCQGGGTCATVCPSGAIQYAYPSLIDSGRQLRKMLQAFTAANGEQAIILFHSEAWSPQEMMNAHENVLPVQVEELPSVGMELCLSALAYGAAQVVLMLDDAVPVKSASALLAQVEWIQLVLKDLGMNPDQICLLSPSSDFEPLSDAVVVDPAESGIPDNKRHALYQSLDYLVSQLNRADVISILPVAAPFGTTSIDAEKCTLCLACVGACPGKALQDGSNREVPEIFFIESNCIQCGACTQTCPEDAISISPRIIFDRERRNTSRSLNQDVPFGCIQCGKPFAPTSVIHKMQDKLKDHYMFNSDRALDRLKMCEDCRVADIVQDPDAFKGNFDPLN